MASRLVRAAEILVVVVVGALLLGSLLGQPVLVGFVESGSMAPALEPGDGFIAVPSSVAGPVEVGDVVVYRAEELHDGGLVTHRVVGTTDSGYLTKGDANPAIDQDGDESPVHDAQIVAVALKVDGRVVVVPGVGIVVAGVRNAVVAFQERLTRYLGTDALLGPRGLGVILTAIGLLAYLLETYRERSKGQYRRRTDRDRGIDAHTIVAILTVGLVAVSTVGMVAPSGTQQIDILSAEFEPTQPTSVPVGESKDVSYTVPNDGLVPVVVFLEPASSGIDIRPRRVVVPSRGRVDATVTLSAPETTGAYRRFLTRHRYFAVLPTWLIADLYRIHPWVPIVAIDALVGIPFYFFGVSLVGTGRLRDRSRKRSLSILIRVHRTFRNLY